MCLQCEVEWLCELWDVCCCVQTGAPVLLWVGRLPAGGLVALAASTEPGPVLLGGGEPGDRLPACFLVFVQLFREDEEMLHPPPTVSEETFQPPPGPGETIWWCVHCTLGWNRVL